MSKKKLVVRVESDVSGLKHEREGVNRCRVNERAREIQINKARRSERE